MHINPYGRDPVLLAVDLVNRPPATADALRARCLDAGLVVDAPVREADLTEVRDYLDAWTGIVDAPEPADRARALNALLAASAAHPRLTDHADTGWHIHYRDDDMTLAGVVCSLVSVGTALHLTGRGMHRLGRCGADGCGRVFADVSRTGRQRYCSPACANRDAVRRHRSR
ncbi:CGNR zinc finger domain-containing protein [Pseudonocardia broussonetiae]|uniref:CGNR zinc finger domain-containing protein n=1 Tax=Pseudonocardia broussonetiae TaxID=2736640 RepID=A0A6M6JNH5_9PSEU|nr:CGNR zinc finger domain-containing protein [Pseudonocardia broussonetiae]